MALDLVAKANLVTQKLNDVNDVVAGGQVAGGTASFTSAAAIPLYNMRGVRILLDNAAALALTNVTTLNAVYAAFATPQAAPAQSQYFAGIYQYVKFLALATQAPLVGQACFWATTQTGANLFLSDETQYTVTTDGSATLGDGFFAGFSVGAPTKGNFGWIQIDGLALALYKITPSTNVIGNAVVVVTTTFTVDALADATAVTLGGAAGLKTFVGIAAEAPGAVASLSLHRVLMKRPIVLF